MHGLQRVYRPFSHIPRKEGSVFTSCVRHGGADVGDDTFHCAIRCVVVTWHAWGATGGAKPILSRHVIHRSGWAMR